MPVLHAQKEGFETYFVDAVGGATTLSHDMAVQRMIQAGSQPITLGALVTEWIRDWGGTPHLDAAMRYFEWYAPQVERVRKRLAGEPYQAAAA